METYPLEGTAVLDQCYMDDLMPSAPMVDEAKETRRQLTELGDQAGHVWARSCSVQFPVSGAMYPLL